MGTISQTLYEFLGNNSDEELGTEKPERSQNVAKFLGILSVNTKVQNISNLIGYNIGRKINY